MSYFLINSLTTVFIAYWEGVSFSIKRSKSFGDDCSINLLRCNMWVRSFFPDGIFLSETVFVWYIFAFCCSLFPYQKLLEWRWFGCWFWCKPKMFSILVTLSSRLSIRSPNWMTLCCRIIICPSIAFSLASILFIFWINRANNPKCYYIKLFLLNKIVLLNSISLLSPSDSSLCSLLSFFS